jgi:hypothetical protein
MTGNPPVDLGAERLSALRRQLETRLRPVLRDRDFDAFDLERVITAVQQCAHALGGAMP